MVEFRRINTTVAAILLLRFTGWLRFIVVSVGLASLIIIVVTVTIWTRAKANRAQTDDNAVHNDEDEGVVTYENVGEASASIRLH
ncbi:hypothetical protein KUCAC02_033010 [Chaenocephalus aceratus]|nr:hypothetical protein KUCAC02_033010 [Chaenocephalus aceratus]